MSILLITFNLFLNIINFIAYLMPFGIFDSISYFVDIYGSRGSIFVMLMLSVFMGVIFLIYLFELFNIPINPEEGKRKEKQDESGHVETFLEATLGFIFGKSNFGTYFPKIMEFIRQLNYKLIPVLIILIMMYSSLFPTSRGYNTVGEFFSANKPIIMYGILGDSFISKEEVNRIMKYNGLKEDEKDKSIILYKDTNIILKELDQKTLNNEKLNDTLDEEVNLYSKVYNDASYQKYIKELRDKKSIAQKKLADFEAKKDVTTDKQKLKEYIIKINKIKDEIAHLDKSIKNVDKIYKNLNYTVDTDDLKKLNNRTKQEIGYKNIKLLLTKDLLKLAEGKITEDDLKDKYKIIETELAKYNGGKVSISETIYNIAEYEKYLNQFIYKMNDTAAKSAVRTIRADIYKQSNDLDDLPSKSQLNKEIVRLESELNRLEKSLNTKTDIDKSIEQRINYVINSNASTLANTDPNDNYEYRQALLLLQYKLLNKRNNVTKDKAFKIQLLNNKVEYIGINAIKNYTLFIGIISTLLTILYYITLVLLAGRKNILFMYIAGVRFFSEIIAEYIGDEKKKAIDKHIAGLVSSVLKEDKDKLYDIENKELKLNEVGDEEWQWFEKNKDHREIYMFMLIEIIIRFGLIYYFLYS